MVATVEWQERAIRTAYFIRIPNVGDLANPSVVSAVSRRPVCHVADQTEPHLLAIGSIMAGARPLSQIWGSGVMHPNFGIGFAAASNVHALRGQLTENALRKGGVIVGDVPLGDPGYLVPGLLGLTRASTPKSRVGLASHYVDRQHPIIRRLLKAPGVVDLNVHEPPDVFLKRMVDCETVVSTSLHGLIFAEALGIPNLWARVSDEIAGGDFKYQDWFSTTRRPQSAAYSLTPDDSIESLATKAELHESTIDVNALTAAFPHSHLEELQLPSGKWKMPIDACRSHPTPVFLISFNRGGTLKRSIAGIRQLSQPTDVVVHDNGSDDPATLAVLDQLETDGVKIVRRPPIASADELNEVNDTVQAYFSEWAEPARYVVSDCDVDLSIADPNALKVYDELLNLFRRAECVGPMLRIRDIPRSYPLFNRIMNRHIEQFWRHLPTLHDISQGKVAVREFLIDTTFALHRAGEPFRRLKSGLRVYEPFEALHLDWYRTDENDVYAESSNSAISHWNNNAEFARYRDIPLEHSTFYAVRRNTQSGGLEVYSEQVPVCDAAGVHPLAPTATSRIPPFLSASAEERTARIAHVEALRLARSSETARWGQAGNHNDDWISRGIALARWANPGERVFEFGAGRSAVRQALPPGCTYTASDIAPLISQTIYYDLNAPILTPVDDHDVALFSGVLEYVHDLERASLFLAENFDCVLCSYAPYFGGLHEEIARRRYSGWFTDLTEADFTTLFEAAGFGVTYRDSWGSQTLFRFDKR